MACGNNRIKPTTNCGNTYGTIWRSAMRAGLCPSLRATSTNFDWRHCSTSARTTRARLGQCVTATPMVTPQKPFPSANEMSTKSTMCGTPIIRSIIQLTTASTRLPPSAAAQPRINAITDDTVAASKPTSTLVERPASVRASMSRPIQSVPKGCSSEGARFFAVKSVTVAWPYSAMPAATTASSAKAAKTHAASVAVRLPALRCAGTWSTFSITPSVRSRAYAGPKRRTGCSPAGCRRTPARR